jgi:hypothetical protein
MAQAITIRDDVFAEDFWDEERESNLNNFVTAVLWATFHAKKPFQPASRARNQIASSKRE